MVKTQISVRYQETDQMGVVHHSVYPIWFEEGRSALIRKVGYSYSVLEQQGLLLPVVDLHCRFVSPVRFDDQILVHTRIKEMRGAKIVLTYKLLQVESENRVAHGETTHLWVDRSMKPVRLQDVHPTLFRILKEEMSNNQ
ncbi:acyl-CoA thioester hydrolase [Marininema mesophilum]|uniref:Acyl-CoA thioester hydrolase n=1 Tax=Marininema mesophilum TaxID=1048340 RepID=A0A1H2XV52_9BACL|nr:thioesterase family protein [Marininema mesophilum]SDW96448.1 acyl-CoA thioester hydrolase [Marininema mesophilum]